MVNWYTYFPLIINTFLLSVPEEAFLVVMSLLLIKRHDLLKPTKGNILRIAAVAVPVAVTSDVLRGIAGFDMSYMSLIAFAGISVLMVLFYRMIKPKEIISIVLAVAVSTIITMAIQLLYFPFILYGTSVTMEALNKPGGLVLLLSLIDRVIEVCIVGFILIKRNSFLNINFINAITQSRILSAIGTFIIAFNLTFIYVMSKEIYLDKILFPIEFYKQILVIVMVLLVPILNIAALLVSVYYMKNKQARQQFSIKEDIKVSISDINFFLKRGEYDRIRKEVEFLERDANELYAGK